MKGMIQIRKKYASDITKEQFKEIEHILENVKKKTKPRDVNLYEVMCGILYVLRSACQWRMLPSDFPNWNTVYYYFKIWKSTESEEESILEIILDKLVKKARVEDNRKEKTSFIIVDAQSVKNTDTAEEKGYDGGKKISGIKRHIAVDIRGLPHSIYITTANVTDRTGAIVMFKHKKKSFKSEKCIG